MARGRMINQVLCASRKFNALETDSARLTYTLLLSFADREGRTEGDPCLVRSRIYPRRTDVTDEMVASYIGDMEAAGLIIQYDYDGETVIQFTQFDKNQIGLRFNKEPPSSFPPPPQATETDQPPDSGIRTETDQPPDSGIRTETDQPPDSGIRTETDQPPDSGIRSAQVEGEVEGEFTPPLPPPGGRGLNLDWIDAPEWRALFREWAENKPGRYKNLPGLKAGYARMVKVSGGDIDTAREIVDRSLGNGWKGLFELSMGQSRQAASVDFEHRIK